MINKIMQMKEQTATFDDLIDVAVQAVKRGLIEVHKANKDLIKFDDVNPSNGWPSSAWQVKRSNSMWRCLKC